MEPVAAWPPVAGFYATRLVRGGPRVAVRIWFGPAVIDGEEQDRGHDWRVEIDGRTDRLERGEDGYTCRVALEADAAWPFCAKEPIAESEYRYLLDHAGWVRAHQPEHPKAHPRKPVDFNALPLRF